MNSRKPDDSDTTLQALKSVIVAYQTERRWGKPVPRDLAISIVLEASELLEQFQWSDDIDVVAKRQNINDEFADTLIYLIRFAIALDIDIAAVFHDKLDRVKQKYPTTVFNPDNKHAAAAYRKVKQSHRSKE